MHVMIFKWFSLGFLYVFVPEKSLETEEDVYSGRLRTSAICQFVDKNCISRIQRAFWQRAMRLQLQERKWPAGKHWPSYVEHGDGRRETPPIDQRPSSFLLSFLQFVNLSKHRVDFGRAAPTFGHAIISFGGIFLRIRAER